MISLSAAAVATQATMTHGCAFSCGRVPYNGSPCLLHTGFFSSIKKKNVCAQIVQLLRAQICVDCQGFMFLLNFLTFVCVRQWVTYNFFCLFFPSLQQKDEVYLNLVLDYVPETVYRVARHYSRAKQTLPMVYVKVRMSLCLGFFICRGGKTKFQQNGCVSVNGCN